MRNKLLVFVAFALVASGCSSQQAVPVQSAGSASQGHHAGPDVRQKGEQPVNWRSFFWLSQFNPYYSTMLTGPDGAMWYNDYSGQQILRMAMDGTARQGAALTSFNPSAMALGSDNKFYAGDVNIAAIDIATTSGSVTQKAIPSGDKVGYDTMTLGPDGNVWFSEFSHYGKITTSGAITEFTFADSTTSNYFDGIVAGPDGNIWISEYNSSIVDKIVPATGHETTFSLGCSGQDLISAQGSLWVACTNNTLVQVTTAGVATAFYNPYGFSGSGKYLTVGPDGNPWFGTSNASVIGEFDPSTLQMTYYYPPANYGNANTMTAGPDGNIWTIENNQRTVQVYILNVMSVSPASLTFASTGLTSNIVVTQHGTSAWTATSSNTAIATVAQGSPANTFKVTSVAKGQCKIIVSDSVGNSFPVHVTVQ
ncbi:MAG TPA: hypothetical protein VKT51_01120 [Candidatus Eremiobacteraceae bacterium]|nr:hypothetical protein [Candidatus Eremiobacteraceae bacterium]